MSDEIKVCGECGWTWTGYSGSFCPKCSASISSHAKPPDTVAVPRELISDVRDWLGELRGERQWWKDEIRCNYQGQYTKLCLDIAQLEALLK